MNSRSEGRLQFYFERPPYIRVRLARPLTDETAIRDAYRYFFFSRSGTRRETPYVYFNVYDRRGEFLYQIAYDFRRNVFVTGSTEYY